MDVLVLGSVLITSGEHDLRVDRPLERAMLVRLALARGSAVPDGRLAADLWGDDEMRHPEHRLRVVASRLRRTLGTRAGALTRSPAGYWVAAQVPDLEDAHAAAGRMHAANRAGDHRAVRAAAAEALEPWRGPTLADLQAFEYAQAEAERLEGWRMELTVARLRADLELDKAAEHLAELARLAGEHPLHEPTPGPTDVAPTYHGSATRASPRSSPVLLGALGRRAEATDSRTGRARAGGRAVAIRWARCAI
jgi:DNA-binding SARP family transcriptional activator